MRLRERQKNATTSIAGNYEFDGACRRLGRVTGNSDVTQLGKGCRPLGISIGTDARVLACEVID
jgi:streptogramin lyase